MIKSDKCLKTRTVDGHTDICRRSKGHDEHRDPARREHYDNSIEDRYWMEHKTSTQWRGGTGRSRTSRGICVCGWHGSNTTPGAARKDAEAHDRDVANFADVDGLILRPGDVVKAKLTSFDGPGHLLGMELTVARLGRSKVYVGSTRHGDHTWAVTASTLTRVKPAPRSAA